MQGSNGLGRDVGTLLRGECDTGRSMYHTLLCGNSSESAAYFLCIAGRIACHDASRFDGFSCPRALSSTCYTLLYIAQFNHL